MVSSFNDVRAFTRGSADAPVLVEARSGVSPEAWQRLLPLVHKMARRNLASREDVEDAVQEVFLRLVVGARSLRDARALPAFTITVAARTLRREKWRRRAQLGELTEGHDDGLTARENPATDLACKRLQGLLARLKARDRQAFLLHVLQGMTLAEIAETLGVSLPTVRRSYAHARKRIDFWARRDLFLSDYGSSSSLAPGKRERG